VCDGVVVKPRGSIAPVVGTASLNETMNVVLQWQRGISVLYLVWITNAEFIIML
jgi:hypothetical protein